MSAPVVVFATIVAKEGCANQVFEILKALIPPTLKEEGCIKYDLHRDNKDPNAFLFSEIWEVEKHLDAHEKTDHFLEAADKLSSLTDILNVRKMTQV